MKNKHLLTFALTVAAVWGLGTNAYIYFFPHLIYNALEKAIVQNGIGAVSGNGSSGIPVNTLYAMPYLASPSTAKSSLLVTGTNHDTLYTVGVLDLSKGPEVLHVPDMADRYYSVEFVELVGRRLRLCRPAPHWHAGRRLPHQRAGLARRGAKWSEADILAGQHGTAYRTSTRGERQRSLATYGLEKQIQLAPLNSWRAGQ